MFFIKSLLDYLLDLIWIIKDGSGTITADELKGIFGIGNEDENLWKDLISDVDQNTDGEV